jgi:hypothetical protein
LIGLAMVAMSLQGRVQKTEETITGPVTAGKTQTGTHTTTIISLSKPKNPKTQ